MREWLKDYGPWLIIGAGLTVMCVGIVISDVLLILENVP